MARKPRPSDKHILWDLFSASKPEADEHRLAFTVRFTKVESDRLRRSGKYDLTEALRTVRRLLSDDNGPTDILDTVVVVELNKTAKDVFNGFGKGLHAHGWVRAKKSTSASDLQAKMIERGAQKVARLRGVCVKDKNPITNGPVDSGWVLYIMKDFSTKRSSRVKGRQQYSASKETKSRATSLRNKRSKQLTSLIWWMREEDIHPTQDMRRDKANRKIWGDQANDDPSMYE